MAALISMNSPSYWDLESDDDEIFTCVSIIEIFMICKVLSLNPVQIFGPNESAAGADDLDLLQKKLNESFKASGLTWDDFSEKIGWDISPFLSDASTALVWNVDELKDCARHVNLNWLSILQSAFEKWLHT